MIKLPAIEIPAGDPFKNDALRREESADALTNLVLSTKGPLVLCIDAPWGQGKTTFLKMWERQLKDNQIPTIFFNAWENDFTDDALVALIGEISNAIKELECGEKKSRAMVYFEKAKSVGAGLIKRSIPVAAKLATAGILDMEKDFELAFSTLAETIAKEELQKYEISKKTLQAFRADLAKLAISFSSEENHKPLVFIIDELDRCRPGFAIEVLEKAKHFFNVENIIFVLGADKSQMGHSIRAIYGDGLNVNGYLRRFIDLDYLLPVPEKGLYVKALFGRYRFEEYFSKKTGSETRYESRQTLDVFTELFQIFDLTLREQEHACSLLSLAIRTTPENHFLYPIFLCFLIVLKIKNPALYSDYVSSKASSEKILEYLKSNDQSQEFLEENYGAVLEAFIFSGNYHRSQRDEVSKAYIDFLGKEELSDRDNFILKVFQDFDFHGGLGALPYLVKKIEIVASFNS